VDDEDEDELLSRVGRGELEGGITLSATVAAHNRQGEDVRIVAKLGALPLVWGLGPQLADLRTEIDAYAVALRASTPKSAVVITPVAPTAVPTPSAPKPSTPAPVASYDLDAVKARKVLRLALQMTVRVTLPIAGSKLGFTMTRPKPWRSRWTCA
jgi:hypothetical protein